MSRGRLMTTDLRGGVAMEDLFSIWKSDFLRDLRDREANARQCANSAKPGGEYRMHCDHAAEMYKAAIEAARQVELPERGTK